MNTKDNLKKVWFERKSFLETMLKNANEAIDTINKSDELNSEALLETICLNELAHYECRECLIGEKATPNVIDLGAFEMPEFIDNNSLN